ncbi:PST family polysaccharide transporter [Ulvibacter sp. MAR_2010_11]|uniref:O-antigen translocase n=1 Tax=Ulvibacter sp. MAR_2010_11 TaxID=1250229 RepID=UPI000C2CB3DD|nr:O-antigen translocase [Ulvibacter sp. MAR_2010_11]PKA83621.1 PST family polysaccharide transporter [Ulvibacter sp. MAR_2010_11]
MKIPDFIRGNLLLKMTSLNAVVIGVRLVIGLFIQRIMAELLGEAGYAKTGQLRSLTQILTSLTSLGTFNGVVKYVSEFKNDETQLQKLFSTAFVFVAIGSVSSGIILFFGADYISDYLFKTTEYAYVIKILALMVPLIGIQRIFNGVVNGLSRYKKFASIELIAYLLSAVVTVVLLYQHNIDGALIAIAITPAIQFVVLLFIFIKVLREYVQFSKLSFKIPMAKELMAFAIMSFVSTILLGYVEIDIRNMITSKITEADSGIWTAMNTLSQNYMVFSGAIFTLYVIPKFATIYTRNDFKVEVLSIYKTLLPLFAVGMILIYVLRNVVIDVVFPGFDSMEPLFKWQLLGDFVRLGSLVLAHQFLAKKMVRNFIFSEILSLALFYGLSYYYTEIYGVEGVVIAHFVRYIIYFLVVLFLVWRYFKKNEKKAARNL